MVDRILRTFALLLMAVFAAFAVNVYYHMFEWMTGPVVAIIVVIITAVVLAFLAAKED